jgi:hypothetical protein
MLAEPVSLLAAGTVPAALVAFGLSMAEVTVLDRETSPRRSVWMASLMKTVGHPLIAYLAARLIFDATGPALLAFVVVAALPTAQNVFTYSQRFRREHRPRPRLRGDQHDAVDPLHRRHHPAAGMTASQQRLPLAPEQQCVPLAATAAQ